MEKHKLLRDLTVVGGGLAGVCAAIAAARQGLATALINDRPVLGGNSSSEIRLWTRGATGGGNRYAEEMGILGEMKLENLYKNKEGNPHIWDNIILDFIYREQNIKLYLNTHVNKVIMETPRQIKEVEGFQMGSEKEFIFESNLFVDATGDGTIGYLSGAKFREGREASGEFQERFAPSERDNYTQGSTIYFYTRRMDSEVKYNPPDFAYDIPYISKLINRGKRTVDAEMSGTDYWWIEYGGSLDTIKDNEEISFELKRIVFGIWNYIKNSGKVQDVANLTLEWVGALPGKRGSRRFNGRYILTQNDIEEQRSFADAVCYGGWYLDYHPPAGIYSDNNACEQTPVNIYQIPLRSLYSSNIDNLLMAGRDISATYAAYSSSRIMNTCAQTGQAVGTASAICGKYKKLPCQLEAKEIKEIQQLLLKEDLYIPGIKNQTEDLALTAQFTASSTKRFQNEVSNYTLRLTEPLYLVLPAGQTMEQVSLCLDCRADTSLDYEVYTGQRPENYRPDIFMGSSARGIRPGNCQWISLELGREGVKIEEPVEDRNSILKKGQKIIIKFNANEAISLHCSAENNPGVFLTRDLNRNDDHLNPCFRVEPEEEIYGAENLSNGFTRPAGSANLWVSNGISQNGEEVQIDLKNEKEINELRLYFNVNLNKELTNLRPDNLSEFHHIYPHEEMPPELVKEYLVYVWKDNHWEKVKHIKENFQRLNVIRFDPIMSNKLKIKFLQTHGGSNIELFEVRVY